MTVRECYVKFVKLLRYATSLVSNNRDQMSRFLTGINRDLRKTVGLQCSTIAWTSPGLCCMSQKVEVTRKKRGVRELGGLSLKIMKVLVMEET